MNYASIVPLIGGETIAMESVLCDRPEYILSYSPFQANDSQLLNYYDNEVPYYLIDKGEVPNDLPRVDIVNAICPCAGLSSLSPTSSADSATNDWMIESARYVLGEVRPVCFWGENAPRFASKMGEPVRARLYEIAKKNGYSFQSIRTRSMTHGLSQVRDRSFYFFWKNQLPPLYHQEFTGEYKRIEDTIRESVNDPEDPMSRLVRKTRPTEDPFYRYVLEVVEKTDHKGFQQLISRTTNPLDWIEGKNISYLDVAAWMKEQGYDKQVSQCERFHAKLSAGGNIMRRSVEIPKDYIGAFVGHIPMSLAHPDEDRYLTIRECLDIMTMPKDFQLVGGVKNLNMICQNVPVSTATDMVKFIVNSLKHSLTVERATSDYIIQNTKNLPEWVDHGPKETLESFFGVQ